MSRWHSYVNTAKNILSVYEGKEPFSGYIREFFKKNKKFGSTDRKWISHLCYCYFRLGKASSRKKMEESILWGLFLCSSEPNKVLGTFKPEWNEKATSTLDQKIADFSGSKDEFFSSVFPWEDQLSEGIDFPLFTSSFFIQPDLFLRLRPGKEHIVMNKLANAKISYRKLSHHALALPNITKVDKAVVLDKEAVIQDLSSQRTGEFLDLMKSLWAGSPGKAWDCCAASGGKSILIHDHIPSMELTVSDVRESILANLRKRFLIAGIKEYNVFVADLAHKKKHPSDEMYDLIWADLPCTGSGTWSRTPEQMHFFSGKKIDQYALLQQKIIARVIPQVKPGGFLLYSTCSVFKQENEDLLQFVKSHFPFVEIKTELLKGYDQKADTLFASLLQRKL